MKEWKNIQDEKPDKCKVLMELKWENGQIAIGKFDYCSMSQRIYFFVESYNKISKHHFYFSVINILDSKDDIYWRYIDDKELMAYL